MEYKIIVDSSANLLSQEEKGLLSIPLKIRVDEKDYLDDSDLNLEELRKALSKTKEKSTTSCPSILDYRNALDDAKRIYILPISKNVSGSYNAANQAVMDFKESNSNVQVEVFDTLTTGPSIALVVNRIESLEKEGRSFEEITKEIHSYLKSVHLLYALCTIQNLAKNGRVNPAVAKIAGILGIHFLGEGSKDGKVKILGQCRGCKKAFSKLINEMKKNGYNGRKVIIHHVNNEDGAKILKKEILNEYPFAEITIEECRGLCTYYAEEKGIMVGYEDSLLVRKEENLE